MEVQALSGKVERGTYADVTVVVHQRLRVSFNSQTEKADVLKKLRTNDFYDIHDEETFKYEKLLGVVWLEDNSEVDDDGDMGDDEEDE